MLKCTLAYQIYLQNTMEKMCSIHGSTNVLTYEHRETHKT